MRSLHDISLADLDSVLQKSSINCINPLMWHRLRRDASRVFRAQCGTLSFSCKPTVWAHCCVYSFEIGLSVSASEQRLMKQLF